MRMSLRQIMLILLAAALCACNKSDQEAANKGIAVSAAFSDSEDSAIVPTDLHLWFYSAASGQLIHHYSFATPQEQALQIFHLPKGNYTAVLGVNLSSPLSPEGESSPSTLRYLLDGVSPKQGFSAVRGFSIDSPTSVFEIKMDMQRFLSELTVELKGAPDGLEVSIEAVNGAEAFHPARKGEDGSYGTPSESPKQSIIPTFSLSSDTTRSQTYILMPTALGREWSFWRIVMKTPEGKTLESNIEAPRMNPGGRYLISLEYGEIQSFMHLSPCTIEDWTQGWVYNGVITDPTTSNE